jgi:lysine 2,3-aminomutase
MMEDWQRSLQQSLTQPAELAQRFGIDAAPLQEVAIKFPMRITPHYLGLIETPGDAIWRQCVPDIRELAQAASPCDPLNEERLAPVPAIIHRYPDRVLLLACGSCAVYCRFCTRKRKVGCQAMTLGESALDEALRYIAGNRQVTDVLLSGGDPLLLEDDRLEALLEQLSRIGHVQTVRIGTRVPVTLPERVTERLCRMLRRYHPLYLNTHFNHPREITGESAAACARLADAGIPLGNQSVLLRGVNDDAAVMSELLRGLLRLRVRPYYLHHLDHVQGTDHFRTTVEEGLAIMRTLRGPLTGMAVPHYVIDTPGGHGKIPLLPDYLQKRGGRLWVQLPDGGKMELPEGY